MTDTTFPVAARRRRPRFRPVEVVEARRLSPRLVAVTFAGDLDGFHIEAPTQHIKILVPGPGEHVVATPEAGVDGPVWPQDQPRPAIRTYTPRRFDPAAGVLEVHFVIHGDGTASAWADRAASGDRLAIAGPGGRMPLEIRPGPWVIAGDESAIPAIGTLLDTLPVDATADVYLETADRADEFEVGGTGRSPVTWLHRAGAGDPGSMLHQALAGATFATDTKVWVACEATAVRRIRRTLLDAARVAPDALVTRGYWRVGEANHPDHDHAEDA